ncbi:ECF-type sigma factor [Pleionea sp. CnH1-48]|uniref:ECF-type sigma factor n=1 Tax=Pleionea sp. CnH1-48 TaxID=2954494 RepID=UPI002096CA40|nr:ECF-type sigma factor [Pleionea sp. CnH1-48]MCO7225490.1 ECF-type sigma factor [Pleionea sp. CnH1-48]
MRQVFVTLITETYKEIPNNSLSECNINDLTLIKNKALAIYIIATQSISIRLILLAEIDILNKDIYWEINYMDITQLLSDSQSGDSKAVEELYPIIYDELHRIAHQQLQKVWAVETLCTTALVNEAYLKLIKFDNNKANNRNHFFAIAAKAMRQILINYAEQKQAQKRGGEWQKITQDDSLSSTQHNIELLLSVHYALEELETLDEELCKLVELRFFAGMTEEELASLFEVSPRTIRRNWKKARALLAQAMA